MIVSLNETNYQFYFVIKVIKGATTAAAPSLVRI